MGLPKTSRPRNEHHHNNNDTFYGAAKSFNEGMLRSFRAMYGLDYVALRPFNVYGPRMDVHGVYTEVLIRWMSRISSRKGSAHLRRRIANDGIRQHRGHDFTIEYPTGSGQERTFAWIAQDLADRIVSIWLPGPGGQRPVFGGTARLQEDPAWKDNLLFYEYFNGDDGAGLGAMHQTGWTACVVDLILDPPRPRRDAGGDR